VLAALLIFIPFVSAIIVNSDGYWTAVSISFVFLAIWLSKLSYEREDPEPYYDENLALCPDFIIIGSRIFPIEALQDLKIIINDFDGKVIHLGRGKRIANGTDNRLSFSFGKEKFNTRFHIASEEERHSYRYLFEAWYVKGIRFYEGNPAGKTYLMEYLNYRQIQEFKRRYS